MEAPLLRALGPLPSEGSPAADLLPKTSVPIGHLAAGSLSGSLSPGSSQSLLLGDSQVPSSPKLNPPSLLHCSLFVGVSHLVQTSLFLPNFSLVGCQSPTLLPPFPLMVSLPSESSAPNPPPPCSSFVVSFQVTSPVRHPPFLQGTTNVTLKQCTY